MLDTYAPTYCADSKSVAVCDRNTWLEKRDHAITIHAEASASVGPEASGAPCAFEMSLPPWLSSPNGPIIGMGFDEHEGAISPIAVSRSKADVNKARVSWTPSGAGERRLCFTLSYRLCG
jgi:hypothetical protein